MELKITQHDARRIVRSHVSGDEMSMDEMEALFERAFKGEHSVVVLYDNRTEEETRPLLIEDAVIQYQKEMRNAGS